MEEIKAEDIMIGNYIQSPYGNYPITEIGYKNSDAYIRQKDCHAGYYLSYCNPIPLTEDVLLKFGLYVELGKFWRFENSQKITLIKENHTTFSVRVSDTGLISTRIKDINYLHELQNLYKVLTKTELIV